MRSIFPVFNINKTIAGAPLIDAIKLFPLENFAELSAYGNWLFGPDSNSATSVSGDVSLTPQSNTELYSANSVKIAARGETLVSDQLQTNSQTVWVAFKYKASYTFNRILTGNLSGVSSGGFAIINGTNGNLSVGFYGASPTNIDLADVSTPAYLNDGDVIFAAISFSSGGGSTNVLTKVSGTAVQEQEIGNELDIGAKEIAIANAYFASGTYQATDIEIYSFGIINKKLTEAEIERLYLRESERLSERGVDLI